MEVAILAGVDESAWIPCGHYAAETRYLGHLEVSLDSRVLYLAPHCRVPPLDGADRRAWRLFGGLLGSGATGVLVGRSGLTLTRTEEPCVVPAPDSKLFPALIALFAGRDYWQSKMLSAPVWNSLRRICEEPFDVVVVNFLYSTPLLRLLSRRNAKLLIDTHNYDPAVFGGFAESARNPLTRLLCRRAIATSRAALKALPLGTTMVHVSETDATAWSADRPDLQHEVVENGCDLLPRSHVPSYDVRPKRLIFVGSLSAQMNHDALKYFAAAYWPRLRSVARMRVVGSNPGPDVIQLCRTLDWELQANVTEGELTHAYEEAHFAVLPFQYGAGSKLKYFEALGRGLPILSTRSGAVGLRQVPASVLVSDSVDDWERAILNPGFLPVEASTTGVALASGHSWNSLAERFLGVISRTSPVRIG